MSQTKPCGLKSESENKLSTLTTHKKAIWPFDFIQPLWPCDSSHIRQYGLEMYQTFFGQVKQLMNKAIWPFALIKLLWPFNLSQI